MPLKIRKDYVRISFQDALSVRRTRANETGGARNPNFHAVPQALLLGHA